MIGRSGALDCTGLDYGIGRRVDRSQLRYRTVLESVDGRLRRRVDDQGAMQAGLCWNGDRLTAAQVVGFDQRVVDIDGIVAAHPVLGPVYRLSIDGRDVAHMSAFDWARPTMIPAIDRPGALPPGAGTMLLDTIARLAAAPGARLRYAGPYPSAALWGSLQQSFTTDGRECDFTRDAAHRWRGGDLPAIAIDFTPAPFERRQIAIDGYAQLRDDLERITLAGATFDRRGDVRRLLRVDDGWAAEVWFGDRAWARVARLAADGSLHERWPLPPMTESPCGQALPPELVAVLLELLAPLLPEPLTTDAIAAVPIVWGDAGAYPAIDRGDRVILHAALWLALAPHGLGRVALAMAEALRPVAVARAIRLG
jgi:hypothetical protein